MYTTQGQNKTYSKQVLIPLWTIHIVCLVPLIGLFGYFILEVMGQEGQGENIPRSFSAFVAVLMIALLMEPLEMVFQSYRILEPWLYLAFQIYKVIIGSVVAILGTSLFVIEVNGGVIVMPVALAFLWAMALSFYASLVYAAIVMHKHRKSGTYDFVKDGERRDDESF